MSGGWRSHFRRSIIKRCVEADERSAQAFMWLEARPIAFVAGREQDRVEVDPPEAVLDLFQADVVTPS